MEAEAQLPVDVDPSVQHTSGVSTTDAPAYLKPQSSFDEPSPFTLPPWSDTTGSAPADMPADTGAEMPLDTGDDMPAATATEIPADTGADPGSDASADKVKSGQREVILVEIGPVLRRHGVAEKKFYAATAAINETVCDPPLSDALVQDCQVRGC